MKPAVAILTNHAEYNPGYSLTGIISDQYKMLSEYGHKCFVVTQTEMSPERPFPIPTRNIVPPLGLIDYTKRRDLTESHLKYIEKFTKILVNCLKKEKVDVVFTHDWVLTGWFLPFGMAAARASKELPNVKWLHWVHSIPSAFRDWWNIKAYGPNHKIAFPNSSDRLVVAEQFRGELSDVKVMHHIKDLRTWMDFGEDTIELIKKYPKIMQADVVQVYPASTDRLSAKRVKTVIEIFAGFKKLGRSVCLVVANQWATTRQRKEDVREYYGVASARGLTPESEFIFTSDFKAPLYESGIPRKMLRELFTCSNVFIFPTREESFGLVAPESVLSSAVIPVMNNSLDALREVMGGQGLYFDFGSLHRSLYLKDSERYHEDIAKIILGRMKENESVRAKTFVRQTYNWNSLYENEYAPIMAEIGAN